MTNEQLQYSINARRSRRLCREMEGLVEAADVYEKMLHLASLEETMYRVTAIRSELDVLWDEQIKLYDYIIEDYKERKRRRTAGLALSPTRLKHALAERLNEYKAQ